MAGRGVGAGCRNGGCWEDGAVVGVNVDIGVGVDTKGVAGAAAALEGTLLFGWATADDDIGFSPGIGGLARFFFKAGAFCPGSKRSLG